jgi:hypothetical protein
MTAAQREERDASFPRIGGVSVKKKLCLLLLGISTMLGCTHTARLYPVQGPLSAQTPLPVLFAKIMGTFTPGDHSRRSQRWRSVQRTLGNRAPRSGPQGWNDRERHDTQRHVAGVGYRLRAGVLCVPCAGCKVLRAGRGYLLSAKGTRPNPDSAVSDLLSDASNQPLARLMQTATEMQPLDGVSILLLFQVP